MKTFDDNCIDFVNNFKQYGHIHNMNPINPASGRSFHHLIYSLISFLAVLKFSLYGSFISLVQFISRDFI